jgi:hypothetical protein
MSLIFVILKLLLITANNRLDRKSLLRKNTLAYFGDRSLKRFITLTAENNDIIVSCNFKGAPQNRKQ